jgi:tetratricopeptide (TPR) repeat protein
MPKMPNNEKTLKIIFVPWGSQDYGHDIWLLENALIFCIQAVLDSLTSPYNASYSDLYTQLRGDGVRERPVIPYSEQQLKDLASKAPEGTTAIIDGLIADIKRSPDTNALESVTLAPRLLTLPLRSFALPDSFVFSEFAKHTKSRDECHVSDSMAFFTLASELAGSVLESLGFDKKLTLSPDKLQISESWDAFCAFLEAKRLAKTTSEKLRLYKSAIQLDPKMFWAHYNRGQLFKDEADFASARRSFMESVDCAKGDPGLLSDVYFEIGLCSISLGDPKTARNFWDQALIYAPNSPTLLVNIAGTYEQEQDFEKASELHEKVLEIDPDNYKALVSLGRLSAMVGDIDRAIELYSKALEQKPDDALRHAILGGCYLAKNDKTSARFHFQRASELDPPRAKLAPVTGSDEPDDMPAPGEYARRELAELR